jgi:DNA-binding XRE family transcriptional regulator
MKIDPALVKKHREARAWSQDHVAQISGVSLRTIQRVEADGTASLETALALASVFGVTPGELEHVPVARTNRQRGVRAGTVFGVAGSIFGATCAGVAIFHGPNSSHDAGIYFGIVGVVLGISLAAIGALSNRYRGHGRVA